MLKTVNKITAVVLATLLVSAVIPAAIISFAGRFDYFDVINYGSYPQSKVEDETLISSLNALIDDDSWTAYDFYLGNGDSGSQRRDDYTFYADVCYEGISYRAVKFTKYRPNYSYSRAPYDENASNYSSEMEATNQYRTGYYKSGSNVTNIYWFRYEPIEWLVLDEDSGLVISKNTLYADNANSTYASEDMFFSQTTLYSWLNSDFKNTAFTAEERAEIIGGVRLPTLSEMTNEDYGFNPVKTEMDIIRTTRGTDYSHAVGQWRDAPVNGEQSSIYWVDDECNTDTAVNLSYVTQAGTVSGKTQMFYLSGVRPAITLNLGDTNEVLGKLPVTYYYDADHTQTHTDYYETGDSITAYGPDAVTGMTFKGWDCEIPATMPGYKLTFFADWELNKHDVTFDANGGKFTSNDSGTLIKTVEYSKPIEYETPVKQGYTFSEWSPALPDTMPDNELSESAVWAPNTDTPYAVTVYKQNADDDEYTAVTTSYQGTTDAPVTIEPEAIEHFVFNAGKSKVSDTIAPDGSTGLYLYYDRETFTVSFDFGVEGMENQSAEYKYEQTITVPDVPERDNFVTEGWRTAEGEALSNICLGDASYVLTWREGRQITFNTDGGSYINNAVYYAGDPVQAPEAPTKEGYTFVEWSPALPETMPDSNIEVTAVWSKNIYKATYTVDGSTYASYDIGYGDPVQTPDAPEKEGYTFKEWSPALPETMPAENITVQATWTVNKYTVTYKAGDEVIKTEQVEFGSALTPPQVNEKEGYTFAWNSLPASMPARDITITGAYTAKVYTVTFRMDGSTYRTMQVAYGESITPPPAPSKAGATFTGWTPEIPATMPASDLTFNAVFKRDPSVAIRAYTSSRTVGYKTSVTFHAVINADDYSKLIWIVDGREYNDDGSLSYKVSSPTASYSVKLKLVTAEKTVESQTENVTVQTGFFAKIVYFFRMIFAKQKLNIDQI